MSMSKNQLLYDKVIRGNLPGYENVDPDDLNIERLVEKAIAKVGNLKWVGPDNLPYDYECDKSDCKTSSVSVTLTVRGTITGTESKEGTLRCIVTNQHSPNKVDFFLIPNKAVRKLESKQGGTKYTGKKKITYSYSTSRDSYGILEPYRVDTLEEVATKK
jgi:hypothetical protein